MLVHLRCHNVIHDRFCYSQKKVYYIWGAPCSGKNTFVMQSKAANDLLVDMDALWQAVTGGEKYYKPDALKSNVFALRDTLLDQIKTRAGKWQTAYVLSTEPRKAARMRVCAAIGAEPIYIEASREQAIARLQADPEREKFVPQWTNYIDDFFENVEV